MSVPSPSLLADHVLLPVLANAAVHGDDRLHVTSGSHERAAGTGGDIEVRAMLAEPELLLP